MFKWILVPVAIATQFAFALEESQVKSFVTNSVRGEKKCDTHPEENFWKLKTVNAPAGQLPAHWGPVKYYKLRYSKFGCELGEKGALVFGPGRGEASIDYYETAYDFIQMGYSPVYIVDHRGQGFSPRLLEDPSKGHVGAFEDYVNDLEAFVNAAVKDLADVHGRTNEPLFYTSNSMGGSIATGYFQKVKDNNPFTAAAVMGTQVVVNYLSYIDLNGSLKDWALRNGIKVGGRNQGKIVRLVTKQRCKKGKCDNYANPTDFGPYKKGSRKFKPNSELIMTHSKERYELGTYFRDAHDWSELIKSHYTDANGNVENWEGIHVGGSTNRWTLETASFNEKMKQPKALKNMIYVPFMVVMGERDIRAYREYGAITRVIRKARGKKDVDMYHHIKFCKDMNKESQIAHKIDICTYVELDQGFHELYKESDHWRAQALTLADDFFQKAVQ